MLLCKVYKMNNVIVMKDHEKIVMFENKKPIKEFSDEQSARVAARIHRPPLYKYPNIA